MTGLPKIARRLLCIQETKVQDEEFPVDAFGNIGYQLVFHGQKKYNGVAIFSDQPIDTVETTLPGDANEEARFLRISYGNITVINTYIPQGQSPESDKFQYKLMVFTFKKIF